MSITHEFTETEAEALVKLLNQTGASGNPALNKLWIKLMNRNKP